MNHHDLEKQDRSAGAGLAFQRLPALAANSFQRQPLLSAGLAAAVGFVIGGGLANGTGLRLLRRSVVLALQMAAIPALLALLRDKLLDMVE
jgi:hypothetical protein